MATGKALDGKPYAGNPHVRFDEGEVAPATTPRRGSLLYKKTLVVALFAVMGIAGFADTKTTYRDAMGRVQGTQTTDSYGRTTYRDAMGRVQGTRTTDSYGRTTYRDAQGRIQGSSTTDRNGRTTYRDAQGRIRGSQK